MISEFIFIIIGDSSITKSAVIKATSRHGSITSKKDNKFFEYSKKSIGKDKSFFHPKDDSDLGEVTPDILNIKETHPEVSKRLKPKPVLTKIQLKSYLEDNSNSPHSQDDKNTVARLIKPFEAKIKHLENKMATILKMVASKSKVPAAGNPIVDI